MNISDLLNDVHCALNLRWVYGNKVEHVLINGIYFSVNAEGRYITSKTLDIKYIGDAGAIKYLSLAPLNQTDVFINYFKETITNEIKAFDKKYRTDVTAKKSIDLNIIYYDDVLLHSGENNCFIYIENKQILAFQVNEINGRLVKSNEQNIVNKDIKKDITFELARHGINTPEGKALVLDNVFSGKVLYLTHTSKEHTDTPFLFISVLGNDSLKDNMIKEYEIYYKPNKKNIYLIKSIMKKLSYHNLIAIMLVVKEPEKMITMYFNGLPYTIKYEEFKSTSRTPTQDELDGKGFPYISEDNDDNIKEIDPMELIEPDTPKDKENDYDTFTKLKLFMESIISNSDSMISHLDLPDVDNIQVKFKNGIIIDKDILSVE